ncbi:MAG: hypothetical protein CL927_15480 [Deltaproteobacteria bacterium]|nr:hypothetical protein [Deltaproteobacteria bacterium]HCH64388.1 hypothetical protein [Deltaproteobacteria bacterium]
MSQSTFLPKAESVTREGQPDGFIPSRFFRPEVLQGGMTRLVVSVPMGELEAVHRALVGAIEPPLKLLYKQLTDRIRGIQLPKPIDRVAVELPRDRVLDAFTRNKRLIYHDGRHQLWVRGSRGEQVVLEEVGQIFVYPDDFLFRDVLLGLGIPEGDGEEMGARDYVRVTFDARCDQEEANLLHELHLVEWMG